MTQEWGPPLTGEQVGRLNIPWGTPCMQGDVECVIQSYFVDPHGKEEIHLPADHIAYKVIEAGWLDKPNVRLWFGGDKAPDDWLKTPNSVLFRSGEVSLVETDWTWEHFGGEGDIIAYIAKSGYREETVKACQSFEDTVTIAKMTEAEARHRITDTDWTEFPVKMHDALATLKLFGLIKPEPTRAERFWQGKERNSLYGDESARALIDAALEFER